MKVGGSPLYFIPGQEEMLDKFHTYLPGKEKEAFSLLKHRGILRDSEQEPAIRVALRALKDFAKPFFNNTPEGKILLWSFHTLNEQEIRDIFESKLKSAAIKPRISAKKPLHTEVKEIKEEKTWKKETQLDIFAKTAKKEKKKARKEGKRDSSRNEKFFNKVKEFLSTKNIEIIDIINYNKTELTLLVRENNKEQLLIAYNKKRIKYPDLLKAYKKADEKSLPYIILSLGDLPKKLDEIIKASKTLSKIEKIS